MFLIFAPMCFYDGLNEERGKIDRTIGIKSIHKNTSIYENSVYMGDREDVITCYPKEHIMILSYLMRMNSRF